MAGDWIKMRIDIADDPAVIGMASALDITEDEVVGKLHRIWSWADKHTASGFVPRITGKWLDRYINLQGFSEQMQAVGWIVIADDGVTFPSFDRHNGKSAKSRAENTERARESRKGRAASVTQEEQTSHKKCDESVTREEKRREEKKEQESTPVPVATLAKQRSLTFASWMESLPEGELAIPADHYVFDHAEMAGLPYEFVELAWEWFRRKYANESKRYTDWRKVFANAVDGAWGGLWRARPAGGYELSPVGLQFQRRIATEAQGAAA